MTLNEEGRVCFTLIDFSFDQQNVLNQFLLERYQILRKHRKKISEQVEIFKKYKKINNELRSDEEYCLRVVQMEGTVLRKLKFQNRKIALAAMKQNIDCYVYLRKEFKQDLEILEEIIKSPSTYNIVRGLFYDLDSNSEMSIEIKKYLVRNILSKEFFGCYYFPNCLLGEREFILELIDQSPYIPLIFVSKFKNDKNFILEVLRRFKHSIRNSFLIESLSPELRNDMELIKEISERMNINIANRNASPKDGL